VIPFIVAAIAGLTHGTQDTLFYISLGLTALFLIILGVGKSFFSYVPWYRAAGETLLIGACTAASSYLIGWAFGGVG
jgi:VIT1/CCC1 family predicted Fe2+/Mn2+ transporter